MDILIIILSVLLAIVTIGFIILIIKYKNDQSHWKCIAEENLNIGKEQADAYIKETVESITENKLSFESMSERELMIETLMTLSATVRRIDRINDKMSWLTDCRRYIHELNVEIHQLSEETRTFKQQFEDCDVQLLRMYNSLCQVIQLLTELSDAIGNVGAIQNKINAIDHNSEVEIQKLTNMQSSLSTVIKDIKSFLDNYSDGPLGKIDSIADNMNDVRTNMRSVVKAVDGINNDMYYIKQDIGDVKYDVDSSKSTISDIYGKVDGSLGTRGDVYNIKNTVEEIKDIVEDIKYRN